MQEVADSISYTVKTPSFEGPLELLLQLVESRKLFINEISLASVADDYLQYMRSVSGMGIGESTAFLAVAATLILIKSRSLLPGFIVTKEEEKDIADLESRLTLYAMIREIAGVLAPRYGKTCIRLPVEREMFTSVFAPDTKLTSDVLVLSVKDAIARIPKPEPLPEVRVRKIISIDVMLDDLTERIASAVRISFRSWQKSVSGEDKEALKGNIIVSFLAMLELVRQGTLDAMQNADFDDIELVKVQE
jgi:segregation and condensation protein A